VYRVVLTRYVSQHATRLEARKAMGKLRLENDDLAFVLELPAPKKQGSEK
jgi:hypothetical protein